MIHHAHMVDCSCSTSTRWGRVLLYRPSTALSSIHTTVYRTGTVRCIALALALSAALLFPPSSSANPKPNIVSPPLTSKSREGGGRKSFASQESFVGGRRDTLMIMSVKLLEGLRRPMTVAICVCDIQSSVHVSCFQHRSADQSNHHNQHTNQPANQRTLWGPSTSQSCGRCPFVLFSRNDDAGGEAFCGSV